MLSMRRLALLAIPTNWISLPFLADYHLEMLPILFIPWTMFIIGGSYNAVNLTD